MTGLSTVPGYQSFAFVAPGDSVPYAIVCADTNQWEVGLGSYAGTTLTRVAILSSSSSDLRVTFGAGTKDIFCTLPSVLAMTINGGAFTSPVAVPSGASGPQVPQAQEVGALAVAQRADVYRRDNIRGAVSQSAGVPTGALFDQFGFVGGGEQTQITRFADGTQIVRAWKTAAVAVNTAQGALYIAGPYSIGFGLAFIGNPTVTPVVVDSSGAPCWAGTASATTTSAVNMYMYSTVNTATARLEILAVGRWYT
jgi:hypothetical protein